MLHDLACFILNTISSFTISFSHVCDPERIIGKWDDFHYAPLPESHSFSVQLLGKLLLPLVDPDEYKNVEKENKYPEIQESAKIRYQPYLKFLGKEDRL